ncbi:MAG: DUF11 domain-containing protein, partial [Planctomycetaceae bacterium]|nr:DUF11 domain-containing protein [Planctomycetaceae bacterium]
FFFAPKIKGQQELSAPPIAEQDNSSRLVPQATSRHNPLRIDDVPLTEKRFQGKVPVSARSIQQTVHEDEPAAAPVASFDDFPLLAAPPAAASFDLLEDSITEPRRQFVPKPTAAKQTPELTATKADGPPQNFSPQGVPQLTTADPFAETQSAATVPSTAVRQDNTLSPDAASLDNAAASDIEGTGTPGNAALEGQQVSNLLIQKVFPDEVIAEQPVTIKIIIQNIGKTTARKVVVTDQVPRGCKLLATVPEAAVGSQNELRWSLGNLAPNDQIILETKMIPLREGEIGSIASISYTGEASARIAVTRPMIKVEVKAPPEVQLGQVAQLEITISNPGTAAATGIVVKEHVPDGLYHKDGRIIEKPLGTLKAKEAKRLLLPLMCTGSGNLINKVVVKADGNLGAEETTAIQASAPVLSLRIAGAKQRFLDLPSNYKLLIANTGNASAKSVDLELALPPSVKFVKTNQSGVYEPQAHCVRWALEELPAQESGEIELTVMPTQIGEQSLKFTAKGQNNLRAESVLPVMIDGIPALTFEIVGNSNLVEAGKDAVYEIRVVNKGTKAANNVKVSANLAEGMSLIKAEGGRYQANGGVVQYETLPLLEPKDEKVFTLAARCQSDGDYRMRVQIISDDLQAPITKEESTRVFR